MIKCHRSLIFLPCINILLESSKSGKYYVSHHNSEGWFCSVLYVEVLRPVGTWTLIPSAVSPLPFPSLHNSVTRCSYRPERKQEGDRQWRRLTIKGLPIFHQRVSPSKISINLCRSGDYPLLLVGVHSFSCLDNLHAEFHSGRQFYILTSHALRASLSCISLAFIGICVLGASYSNWMRW